MIAVLTDVLLKRLAQDAATVRDFPFLKPTSVEEECCGRRSKRTASDWNQMKRTAANLSRESLRKLLRPLQVSKIRIIFRDGQRTRDEIVDLS